MQSTTHTDNLHLENNNAAFELSDVQFSHTKNTSTLLNIPAWSVMQQQQIFIHGASGVGKSTLLNILSGVLTADSGQVNVLGHDFRTMKSWQRDQFRAKYIGYVSQQFNLIPYLSAVENVQLAQFLCKTKKITNTSNAIQLLETLNIAPSDCQKAVHNMSIGQQQRVAIARALINQPHILIADEPTSSLDKKNTEDFMALLKEHVKQQSITLLFVSHDLSLKHHFECVEDFSHINQTSQLR